MADIPAPISLERRGGRAPLRIVLDRDRPSITPASRLCLHTVDKHSVLLTGNGIDWGSGSGVLAIAAAAQPGVEFVLGLELDDGEIRRARTNAELNGVADRVRFLHADMFDPLPSADGSLREAMRGPAEFLISNPPNSTGDDGLGWRRAVLTGARDLLTPGADVLLQVSRQFGARRTSRLGGEDYEYRGLLESTDWVPYDQTRPDLREALDTYAVMESRTGETYEFLDATEKREIGAVEAAAIRDQTNASPLSQWQVHRFTRA